MMKRMTRKTIRRKKVTIIEHRPEGGRFPCGAGGVWDRHWCYGSDAMKWVGLVWVDMTRCA